MRLFKNRKGMARNVVDIVIATVIVAIIAFVATYILGELYSLLPGNTTGLSLVSSITDIINGLWLLFGVLIIELLMLAKLLTMFDLLDSDVVDIAIKAGLVVVIALMAAFIIGELYNALTGSSFISAIISAISSLGPFFGALIIDEFILAFAALIMLIIMYINTDDGGAVAGA